MRFLEIGVNIRCNIFLKPYGDQGLLINKELYFETGGFAPLHIMEDLEFIQRVSSGKNPFTMSGKKETRTFCYIDDAVNATSLVAEHINCDGEIIHVGNSSEEINVENLAKMIMREMKVELEIDDKGRKSGSVSRRCPDISKFNPELPPEKTEGAVTPVKLLVIDVFPPVPSTVCVI